VTPPGAANAALASIKRRLLSLIYEALILIAVLLAGALPMVMLVRGWDHTAARAALQVWLLLLCAGFYVRQWTGAGQTLPMKTWRLRLVARDGSPVGASRALARYAGALISVASLGLGFAWALGDRERQFLHDRLAGTRLVVTAD
jgi:uncharacterized RDD family membrane protein YckC